MEQVILKQLISDYKQIVYQFRLDLKVPVILFTDVESVWGRWNPHHRTIELRRKLVEDHSWDTVLYVLKHEMAHQIVTEIFGLPDSHHAESFQKACDLLSLPPEFRRGSGELTEPNAWKNKSKKTETITNVVERIQKLLALASSTNEAEAAVAVTKAHELMRKYNIQENVYRDQKDKEDFRYILYDTQKQRLSPVYSHLASMLIHFYNVDVIFTSQFNAKTLRSNQCLEIYGRETHVVVAEYVLHFMLRTLESLWKAHAKKTGAGALQKKSFQLGILAGFQQKLEADSAAMSEASVIQSEGEAYSKPAHAGDPSPSLWMTEASLGTTDLLIQEDESRRTYIQKRYPRLRSRSSGRSMIDTSMYARGVEQGREVQLRKGIHKTSTTIYSLKGSTQR